MAKKAQNRAFFEILAEERRQERERVESEEKPAPLVRRMGERPRGEPKPAPAETRPAGPSRWAALKAMLDQGQVTLSYFWVAIALVIVLWLCALCYLIGTWTAPGGNDPPLPGTPPEPTFGATRAEEPEKGLLGNETPGPEGGGPAEAGSGPGGGTPPAPAAEQWRVRIARLALTNQEYTDRLREFLRDHGIETDLELRQEFYYLYTTKRFESREKAEALAPTVNALLREFGRQTRWRVSADAFAVRAD